MGATLLVLDGLGSGSHSGFSLKKQAPRTFVANKPAKIGQMSRYTLLTKQSRIYLLTKKARSGWGK
ncbi:hypothetical protein PCANC_18367 [Puccinia coronata f. sp. avenae]|uniref:Uncharacterized protein n=1 Tax=Puccinia coronata f. sp. avenae TaxID=200324 RepID=A0A2N5V1D1_9BASI|nr:hypothetical protein PCANC_18367 [Puccinia coronata f. sp. avenae]